MKSIDKEIIDSCISQNRNAQKQLYTLLLPYLRAVTNRYIRDNSYSSDVLQESFVKIFKSIGTYDSSKSHIKHWAAKITINNCFNYNKRVIGSPKEEFVIEKHQAITLEDLNNGSDEDILLALKKMPEPHFEVFNLYIIDGYSHQEISELLSINPTLSRKRLSRAKSWLKKTFANAPNLISKVNLSIAINN